MFFRNHKATGIALGFILIFALGLQGVTPAQASAGTFQTATVYRVTTTGLTSAPCGDSWTTPCDLQYALSVATSDSEIWIASGTYYPDQNWLNSSSFLNGCAASARAN